MRIKNILISIMMLGLIGYGGLKFYMYYQAKKDIDALLAPARVIMDVQYDQISSSVFGPVGIKGLRFRFPKLGETITVGEFKLLSRDNIGKMMNGALPSRLRFRIVDLEYNLSLLEKIQKEAELAAQRRGQPYPHQRNATPEIIKRLGYQDVFEKSNDLHALGYDHVKMDVDFDLQFNPDTHEAHFKMRGKLADMGDLLFDFSFTDLSSRVANAVLGVKIKEMKWHYIDDGYIDRLLKLYADEQNMELEPYRKLVAAKFEQDVAAKKIKLSADSVKSIKRFIENPKSIIVTAYPYRPVGIESIKHYKPGDVPMLLNLQARLD